MSQQILEAKAQILDLIRQEGGAMNPRALMRALPQYNRRVVTQAIQLAFERGEVGIDDEMHLTVSHDIMQAA